MNRTVALAKRFREVILSGTWIANTNFRHQLEGLDWQIAIAKQGSLNSIALLTQHIHYYIKGVKNVLEGGSLDIKDKYSFDFPPVESQDAWNAILSKFFSDAESFASLVENLPEEKLDAPFVDEKYGTYLRNIDGMIEHSYYHLGQVVLIKKMLLGEREKEK